MNRKVLHVSEAFGGGIVSSLYSFAANTPEIDHHLLICERKNEQLGKDISSCFSSVSSMRRNLMGSTIDIRRKIREIQPDFVHLHSSYAGVFGRLAGIEPDRLVYSPHGFAFQRLSAPRALRWIYFLIERLLSRRSANFAGVSLDEVNLSREMNPASRSIFVPNTTDIPPRTIRHFAGDGKVELVCMGRLCPQKDPGFLVETLKRLPDDVFGRISVTWIGSGDPATTRELTSMGVDVTGWVNHAEAGERLASCDLYFHTAAWEGFPMTVIEAAALGRPVLLRSIRAFDGFRLPPDALADTAADAAGKVTAWVRSPSARSGTYAMIDAIREICAPTRQGEALRELYRIAS